MTGGWDFARTWQRIASAGPERPALARGTTVVSWAEFDDRAAAVAGALLGRGAGRGDVAALCLRDGTTLLTCWAASHRIGLVPAGITHRSSGHELRDLLDRLAPAVVFFDHASARAADAARRSLRRQPLWCHAGLGETPPWAVTLASLRDASSHPAPVLSAPDDLMIKCTGGTSGTPKAVRWRVGDVFRLLNDHNPWVQHDLSRPLTATSELARSDARVLIASPLVHGTGLTRALAALTAGGAVVTPATPTFDPAAVLDDAEQYQADTLVIVGDAFARPLATELGLRPRELPQLRTIASSGLGWSARSKAELLRLLPHTRIVETFGATEVTGMGVAVAAHGLVPATGVFRLGRHARVLTDDGVEAAAGQDGRIGVSWPHPAGLHPDGGPLPNGAVEHRGQRFLLSGDRVRRLDRGQFLFLGRDEDCINTGGLKVFAPEVAEVLASHPAVDGAAVFAMPHDHLGQTVAALVVLQPAAEVDTVLAHARTRLAGYKLPRLVATVEAIPSTPAGKVDLPRARALLRRHLHAEANTPGRR